MVLALDSHSITEERNIRREWEKTWGSTESREEKPCFEHRPILSPRESGRCSFLGRGSTHMGYKERAAEFRSCAEAEVLKRHDR